MISSAQSTRPPTSRYRWVICGLLFFSTTFNYLDRQVISFLKEHIFTVPVVQGGFGWSNADYSYLTTAFTIFYGCMTIGMGWVIDRIGTRIGLALSLIFWSLCGIANAFVGRLLVMHIIIRSAFAVGEAGNFPAAIKTVAEWFPKRERALATGIFNSGANFGAMAAAVIVPLILTSFSYDLGWKLAYILTGAAGFLWLIFWFWLYDTPQRQKRLSRAEYDYIHVDDPAAAAESAATDATGHTPLTPSPPPGGREDRPVPRSLGGAGGEEEISPLPNPLPTPFVAGRGDRRSVPGGTGVEMRPSDASRLVWWRLFGYRQGWAFFLGKFLTDGVWWFYLFWLPDYLKKQFQMNTRDVMLPTFIVFGVAIFGSVYGGSIPLTLIKKGMPVYRARMTAMLLIAFAPLIMLLTQFFGDVTRFGSAAAALAVATIAIGAAAHQAWSANLFTTVSDMFPKKAVASVTGLGTAAGAIGTAATQLLAGRLTDVFKTHPQTAYLIMFVICALSYLIAWAAMNSLVPRHQPITDL